MNFGLCWSGRSQLHTGLGLLSQQDSNGQSDKYFVEMKNFLLGSSILQCKAL